MAKSFFLSLLVVFLAALMFGPQHFADAAFHITPIFKPPSNQFPGHLPPYRPPVVKFRPYKHSPPSPPPPFPST
ncbi:transmembrane protein, putative [Medicago truncatula]|uniref:Transmembrane protein, putative n=1 Tax=Medicago truncatula TaxID=3880 RepID=G7IYT8_MEDTR|nr:transmembrane protein, putative [Medicago truncatula]